MMGKLYIILVVSYNDGHIGMREFQGNRCEKYFYQLSKTGDMDGV